MDVEQRLDRVLERLDELEEEKRELRKELRELRDRSEEDEAVDGSGSVSRRQFLKGIGAATFGFGALSLLPSAAANVKITDTGITKNGVSNFWSDGSSAMSSDLDLSGNNLVNVAGTTDASSGNIRLANASSILARDSGNSSDFGLDFSSSNTVRLNGADLDADTNDLTNVRSNGNSPVVSGTNYEIQKDGSDASGIINFKTS